MNFQVDDVIVEALTLVPRESWRDFFDTLAHQELTKLPHTPDVELTVLKARVILIHELEHFFSTARNQPIT